MEHSDPAEIEKKRATARRTVRGMQWVTSAAIVALILTVIATWTGYQAPTVADSPVVESRELVFADVSRGVIEVREAHRQELLLRIGMGEQVFLRTVVRGLARQRKAVNEDRDAPFTLSRLADGRLTLSDEITGELIQLNAFGPDNLVVFEQLLEDASFPQLAAVEPRAP
ncbi:MAG: photosynthetic complex assembly protein PuhC [Pseudomonadota bacterium]